MKNAQNGEIIETSKGNDEVTFEVEQPVSTNEEKEEEDCEDDTEEDRTHFGIDEPYDPRLELASFQLPKADMPGLLVDYEKNNKVINENELLQTRTESLPHWRITV